MNSIPQLIFVYKFSNLSIIIRISNNSCIQESSIQVWKCAIVNCGASSAQILLIFLDYLIRWHRLVHSLVSRWAKRVILVKRLINRSIQGLFLGSELLIRIGSLVLDIVSGILPVLYALIQGIWEAVIDKILGASILIASWGWNWGVAGISIADAIQNVSVERRMARLAWSLALWDLILVNFVDWRGATEFANYII